MTQIAQLPSRNLIKREVTMFTQSCFITNVLAAPFCLQDLSCYSRYRAIYSPAFCLLVWHLCRVLAISIRRLSLTPDRDEVLSSGTLYKLQTPSRAPA